MSKNIEIPSVEELMKIAKENNDKKPVKGSIDDFVKISNQKPDIEPPKIEQYDACDFCTCKGCDECIEDDNAECCGCCDYEKKDEDNDSEELYDLTIPSREELDSRFNKVRHVEFDDEKYQKYKNTCIQLINALSFAGSDSFTFYDCNPISGTGSVYAMKLISELKSNGIEVSTKFAGTYPGLFYIAWGNRVKKN